MIATIILHTTTVGLMMRTALMDPGIVPKNVNPYEVDMQKLIIPFKPSWGNLRNEDVHNGMVINSHYLRLKYCKTCMV